MQDLPGCEHVYSFLGVVVSFSEYSITGSSAYERILHDRFYCSKCLSYCDINERKNGNSYSPPLEGAMPK